MSFATQLAAEIAKRGYATSVRREPEGAEVCVIESRIQTIALGDDDGDEHHLHDSTDVEIWDYGHDPCGNIDIRWMDAEGRSHEISASVFDAAEAADRIVGPSSS